MDFIPIQYNGSAPYRDKTPLRNHWQPGQIREVADAVAKQLLRYLEFSRAPEAGDDASLRNAKQAQAVADETKAKKKRLEADTLVDVDLMDKDQLSSFAKENYGVKLDKRSSIEDMRAKAHELVLGTGVVA